MKARLTKTFPCFIHNLKNYDSKFLMKELGSDCVKNISIIPHSTEKITSLTLNKNLRFVDSYSFMPSSLSSLVETLKKSRNIKDFKITKRMFKNRGPLKLLLKKGIFPYSHLTGQHVFSEKKLPPKNAFFNDLKNEAISTEEYKLAQNVWKSFRIKNLGEYTDIYCELDVTLLADCMLKTGKILWDSYGLDLGRYLSLPMVAFDAVLKLSNIELEYIKDPDMYLWLEKALRGGYCSVGGIREARANNKYMGKMFNSKQPTSFISYLDCNNLYGNSMVQPLPVNGFHFLSQNECDHIEKNLSTWVAGLKNDDPTGYYLEVDLHYPNTVHDNLNDYPPAPCSRRTQEDEFSPHQRRQIKGLNIQKNNFTGMKLIGDLHDKKGYITHYRNLKMFLSLGIKVTKVHKVLRFNQSPWMKNYIEFNTRKRALAITDYEKDFWKLLNNSAFGKTLEQKRKHQNMNVVKSRERALFHIRRPTFQRMIEVNENVFLCVKKKISVLLDRPIAVGVGILELSKETMLDFHYNIMKKRYHDKATLLYTDTDSLVYHIKTNDFYNDMWSMKEHFDMSDFSGALSKWNDQTNKKVLGKFKDESPNKVIAHFAASKPKVYGFESIEIDPNENETISSKMKIKGVQGAAVKAQCSFEQLKAVLKENRQTEVEIKSIRSHNFSVGTEESKKKALNGFDSKRLLIDAQRSLAYGHKDIPLYI